MELLVPTDKTKFSFLSLPAAKCWHTNRNSCTFKNTPDPRLNSPLYNGLIQTKLHTWSSCELIFPTFIWVCVSFAQRNGLENSACSCKKCNRQLERERVKKQGPFCLQQPRFYPLVAERCLALQISGRAWTDTGGLSWPCSRCPRPSSSPPPPPTPPLVLRHANKPEWESSWEGERKSKAGGGKRDNTEAGRRKGEGDKVRKEGNGWLKTRAIFCVFMVDRKKKGEGGGSDSPAMAGRGMPGPGTGERDGGWSMLTSLLPTEHIPTPESWRLLTYRF